MEKQKDGYTALLCDDCKVEIFANVNMVMLKDELWMKISNKFKDAYCDCCIEKRMGRPIELEDLKPISGLDFTGTGLIPCNAFWLNEKHPEKFKELKNKKISGS